MENPSNEPKSASVEIDGHVVTTGCVFHADTSRWEPTVTVRTSWNSGAAVRVETKPEHFQDTSEDAMRLARDMAEAWLAEHGSPEGTSDAAV